ncbi:hypothetical protein [Bacteroides reticulotermitis]|uniref:Uncharacterized protein n=1 Tax=Bacteroides reticulotermitis TaxID=1133319 RepID=A0A840D3F8_9BACE|nr:hypothetical protein [Bacteroides reticulotermitis]MBB4044064.1 hypothetical protein [Bacteroides reticulotermitis]
MYLSTASPFKHGMKQISRILHKHYKFTLRFDKTQKKLLIENLVETVWSEEEESLSENVNK